MQADPCIPVGLHLQKADVDPTSGPTGRLSHLDLERPVLVPVRRAEAEENVHLRFGTIPQLPQLPQLPYEGFPQLPMFRRTMKKRST